MPPIVLKIKGNESFLPFSNLDQEELSKTWRVCTKVKDSLENGSRLENLSWRLWFIQNVLFSNDVVKSKSKFQKWSSKTTREMENEQELTPTTSLKKNDTAFMSQVQHTESLLDYSLDAIKPVGTENFILNQFTSDQEGNQMIELKDIFPFSMQDDFFNAISETNDASYYNNNTSTSNSTSWPSQNNSTIYQQPNYDISTSNSPYINDTNNNGYTMQQDFYGDPISGIHSLFADHIDLPAMNIPVDNVMMQQDNYVVDFNNAAYVAAAAAATAAALTTIPNATLHNKLLATLPRQTLASAERLLSPANKKRPSLIAHKQQQQRMTEALPPNKPLPESNKKQQHYFSTFQLDTGKNGVSPSATKHTKQNYSSNTASPSPTTTNDENRPQCSNCDATSTPLWRRSADDKILCNACGLYLKLHNASRPKHLKPSNGKNKDGSKTSEPETEESPEDNQANLPQTVCSNCRTSKTPLWRRDNDGNPLCNACGLYLKLHNEKRPLSMKTDIIKKRQRTETLIASSSADEQSKKPRYYDQQALEKGSALGYRNASSSLPGTGILMMTTDSPPS